MPIEENEISEKSQGGTEQTKRGLAEKLPEGLLDDFQIICSRVREIEEDKIRIYWLHDLPEDPETNHLKDQASRERFHKLVFCGQWQYERYKNMLNIPYDQHSMVIDTPIETFTMDQVKKNFDRIDLVYTSTPQRGLALLVPVFIELAKQFPNIHLHVFSSYKIYGWDEADKQFEPLYKQLEEHPQATYYGFAPNEKVREVVSKAHIFAYPSIWLECNSRSLIEAMSAGLMCVHPNVGGLVDTSGGLNFQYQGHHDANTHANIFFQTLKHAVEIVAGDDIQNYLRLVKMYADNRFGWPKIAGQWTDLLEQMKVMYPDEKSRLLPQSKPAVFQYKS